MPTHSYLESGLFSKESVIAKGLENYFSKSNLRFLSAKISGKFFACTGSGRYAVNFFNFYNKRAFGF